MIDLTLRECPFCGNPAEIMARNEWNTRKRKNKLTFNEEYAIEHEEKNWNS